MILYKRKFYFFVILLLIIASKALGQDPHFSQFYANPLYLNPAFAGTINCPRFSLNFRDQWPEIKKNFITFSGSYDQHINVLHGGIGVLVSADIAGAGIIQTYNVGAIYNFRVKVSDQFNLQFALQGNYLLTSFNSAKLRLASGILDQLDLSDLPDGIVPSRSQFDAGFGLMGYTSYLYFGLAIHHLLPLQKKFINNPTLQWDPKWSAHIGGKVSLVQKVRNEVNFGDIFFYPNLIFISQGNFYYLHEGFYFNFYPFTLGTWLRHNFKNLDALIISCGIEYKIFRIGYSYDFNLSKLEHTGGAHEISLQFTIPCNTDKMNSVARKKNNKISPVECPRF